MRPTSAEPDRDYRDTVKDVYAAAALEPDTTLCCIPGTQFALPGLDIPARMLEMNYGCGATVHPQDVVGNAPILYIGVGGGLEALQFAYYRRRPGGVIAVDPVAEMREAARANLQLAAKTNPWFDPSFVDLRDGDAAALPAADGSAGLVAQNCLFNVFQSGDLHRALREVHRVLGVGGRFSTSDPITTEPLPAALRANQTLRARCISGCITYEEYLGALLEAGFTQLTVRARVPYRWLLPVEHPELSHPVLLESIEMVAAKAQVAEPQVFTGRTATYCGAERSVERHALTFPRGTPFPVSDAVADALAAERDFFVSRSTYHARAAGCC